MLTIKQINEVIASSDAKGIEKVMLVINGNIVKVQIVLTRVFEGKPLPPGKKHKNPLDSGIVPIVKSIADIDLCNIFDYAINKIPNEIKKQKDKKDGSSKYADGTKNESREKTQFEKALQFIQDKAYEAQKIIDDYYLDFADSSNITAKSAIIVLCKNLKLTIKTSDLSANSELVKGFPQLQSYNNFLENVFGFFDKLDTVTAIDDKTFAKVKGYIDTTRGILIAIQSLDPKQIAGLALSLLPPKVKEDINKLNKIVKPEKLLPFLKTLQRRCTDIQTQVNLFVSTIKNAQSKIQLVIGIINLFLIVKKFILGLINAIPSILATIGIEVNFTLATNKLDDFIKNLIKRLTQLNVTLLRAISVSEYIIGQIDQILYYLRIIIANLERCENGDPQIVKDLKASLDSLQNANQVLKDFKSNYENKKTSSDNTFGDNKNKYTIKIVTEQLTDEGISLKRRYGIALDKYGALVASSTPTFASLDSIIIDEVKLILVSKKLVNPQLSALSTESIGIINESSNFLENEESIKPEDINVNIALSSEDLDSPDNENEELGLGLNAFVNKLPGGKKLRKRVQAKLDAKKKSYGSSISGTGVITPNVGGTSTSQQPSNYEKSRSIEDLQRKRAQLVKQRETAIKTGPAGLAIVAAKTNQINDIDKQIEKLRK